MGGLCSQLKKVDVREEVEKEMKEGEQKEGREREREEGEEEEEDRQNTIGTVKTQ